MTSTQYDYKIHPYSPVAQSVEQMAVNHWVGGSSPSRGAYFKKKLLGFFFFTLKNVHRKKSTVTRAFLLSVLNILATMFYFDAKIFEEVFCIPISYDTTIVSLLLSVSTKNYHCGHTLNVFINFICSHELKISI